jgi:plasmid segregation protein ParM
MNTPSIDLLVVGLPVANYSAKRRELTRRLEGEHEAGNGHRVVVKEVWVLPQSMGTLVAYARDSGRQELLQRHRSLIVDCGSRTFDWLLAEGFRVVDKKSHSANRGMLHVLQAIGDSISREIGERYYDFERIDRALRLNDPLMIAGKKHSIHPHATAAKHIASQAVQELRNRLDVQDDSVLTIDNIVVSGGGAFFFKEAIQSAFPRHELRVLPNSMYSNVRGFQIAGTDLLLKRQGAVAPTKAGATA